MTPDPLKILVVSESWRPAPDSAATHLAERVDIWSDAGHDVTVVTGPGPALDAPYELRRTGPTDGGRRGNLVSRLRQVSAFEQLAGAVEVERPDVVLSSSPPIHAGTAGMRLAARHGVPHVLEVRDLWPESVRDLTPLGGWPLIRGIAHKTAAALSSADLIIAVTDAIAAHTKANPCCTCEVVTIPTGASAMFSQQTPSDSFRAALGLRNGPVVGYLGTLGRAQDVDAIAQAARRLDAMGVGFLVVGGGRRAARLRKRLQGSGVVIERQRSRDAMPQYWALCDVAIVALRSVPSLATAIPMKMYEGMAMGIPLVVSAPDGEATKLAAQSGCGVAVDPGDGIAIANATIKLLEDAESRQACAAAGRMAASGLTRTMQARACLQALRTALDASH